MTQPVHLDAITWESPEGVLVAVFSKRRPSRTITLAPVTTYVLYNHFLHSSTPLSSSNSTETPSCAHPSATIPSMHSDQPALTSTTGAVDELEALLTAQRLSFLASSLAVDSPEILRSGLSAFRAALNPRRLPVASRLSTEALPTHEASPSQDSTVLAGEDKSASSGPTTCMCKDGPGIDTVLQLKNQLDAIQIEVLRGSNQINELIQSMMELKTEIQAIHAALEEPKTIAFRAPDVSSPVIISPAPIRPPSLEDFGHTMCRVGTPRVEPSPSPDRTPSPRPGLRSLKQSVATTPVITPYIAAPHLPGIPSRTVTPIVTCSPTPRFGTYCGVIWEPEMKEPLGSRLSSPAIPPPQEVAIGRPTALLLSVTCPVTPVLPSASQRSHPPSPRGRSPCALPVQPSGDCVVLPSDTQSSTCTCKTIRQTRKGAMGRKRRSTFLKKTCEHCLAQAPGQLPTPTIAILPLTVTTLPNFPTPETPPYAPPFVPKESILEPPPVEPASLPLDGACSPRARSPSLHRVRVPLPKRSGSPQSVISYDEPRALELPTPVRIAIALHTFATFQHDELAFERGDTLTVVEAASVPTGWLLGQNASGKRGLFPARYVELRSP